jgi:hypothetical protein
LQVCSSRKKQKMTDFYSTRTTQSWNLPKEVSCTMESRDMVGHLESTFPHRFKGRKVFTYHDGRLLSHSISFYQHHTRCHVNGFGGCWWGLHFMRGKYQYGCAPVQRFRTVSSRKIRPSDGRLSFLPKLFPQVLTLIQYKVSDDEFRRALAQ